MADIGNEIDAIRAAKIGEEVREHIADALEAMNEQAAAAQEWATGDDDPTDVPGETNNAAYYAAQAAESAATLVIDDTLSVSGRAADAKATGVIATSIKNATQKATGNAEYVFIPGAWNFPASGGNTATFDTSDTGICAQIPCSAGDVFFVRVYGAIGIYRAYAFVNSEYTVLEKANGANAYFESKLVAPENAAYLLLNNRSVSTHQDYYAIKDIPLVERNELANSRITSIGETILQETNYVALPSSMASAGFVRYTTGEVGASETSYVTNYICVEMFDKILYKRRTSTAVDGTAGIAFYGKDLTFISGESSVFGQQSNEYVWKTTDVPEGAVYVRCSAFTDTTTYGDFEIKGHSNFGQHMADFSGAIYYPIAGTIGISYGGIKPSGTSNENNKNLRYLFDGKGAVNVKAGSVITPNTGYNFSAALYSSYSNNSSFVLKEYVATRTTPYTIPYDCFVRIAFGTTNNDVLWQKDSEGQITLTEEGTAAASGALTLSLIGGTVKEEIQKLEDRTTVGIWDVPNRLETEIPLNALAFHELFAGLVADGKLTRTLLGKADNDDDYPIYLYTLRNDMNHLNSSYRIVQWNGSNELYQRPKVWLDSGIHGNERTTPYALYDFIYKLCTKIEYQQMRNAFDWYFVPLVNPWGFSNSAIKTSTGILDNGSTYSSSNKSQYTIVANTTTTHQGIRRNKDGIDINRDFGNFVSAEAQMIRDLLDTLTADERNFIFAMDSHQSSTGDDINIIGAFMSLNYSADDAAKALMWGKWMQAGAKTEMIIADDLERDVVQSVYTWDGTNAATARNYLANYADYSMCFEGGQTCLYYSQSDEWSNPVARTFTNTQYQGFLHLLTKHWMI